MSFAAAPHDDALENARPAKWPHVPRLGRRDRIAILSALALLTLLAWAYLVWMAMMMGMMGMTGMEMGESAGTGGGIDAGVSGGGETRVSSMSGMSMPAMEMAGGVPVWTVGYFVMMLSMWVIMMVGMMVPTAVPMTLIYAAISRKAAGQGATLAPTGLFVGGYVMAWALFSVGATFAQWGLDSAALLSAMMVSTSPMLGASLLIAAGVYQLTPWKNACLMHCRMPAHYISQHWRDGSTGALSMGFHHGLYCLGCCWALMLLLFFGGVMNLTWILMITLFVLLEKVLPLGQHGGRIAGVGMILLGVATLLF